MFIGDTALPPAIVPQTEEIHKCFSGSVIANLEGGIAEPEAASLGQAKLFNAPAVLDYLNDLNVRVVSLANNHVLDIERSPARTVGLLAQRGIQTCGAGDNFEQAAKPAILEEDGRELVFLAFGWEPIGCRAAGVGRPGANPLRPKHVLRSVESARAAHPDAVITLLMHWNYELELYPQPMHRQLAFAAIDAGANAIVGSHSHCVQGVEVYKQAPVVYGLGNWFLPHGEFFGGKLTYPDLCLRELAFEWEPDTSHMICHWFEYERERHRLTYVKSEGPGDSEWITELTPFAGMSRSDYVDWFCRSRRKRMLLPVYRHYDDAACNWGKDRWVALRNWAIGRLVDSGAKQGPR